MLTHFRTICKTNYLLNFLLCRYIFFLSHLFMLSSRKYLHTLMYIHCIYFILAIHMNLYTHTHTHTYIHKDIKDFSYKTLSSLFAYSILLNCVCIQICMSIPANKYKYTLKYFVKKVHFIHHVHLQFVDLVISQTWLFGFVFVFAAHVYKQMHI